MGEVIKQVLTKPMSRLELEIRSDNDKLQSPDCNTRFSSYSEAINRLLPYHVNQQYGDVHESDMKQDGEIYRNLCHNMMERKRRIQEKLQQTRYRQANVGFSNAESLLLERLWAEDNFDMKSP